MTGQCQRNVCCSASLTVIKQFKRFLKIENRVCRKKIEDEMSSNSYVYFPNSYILIARARIDYEMVHNVGPWRFQLYSFLLCLCMHIKTRYPISFFSLYFPPVY